MTCAELDILLCDYVDGALYGEQKSALELHLAECAPCAELYRDVTGAIGFMERAEIVAPPPELLTRILHEIPYVRPPWWQRMFGGWFEAILQPRYVMSMAMTLVSFSMIAHYAGIHPRDLQPSDLNPVKIWVSVDDRAHRAWDRTAKYYENLRWVLELQSRLKEWNEQDQEYQKAALVEKSKQETKQVAPDSNAAHQKRDSQ
jgi:anti-sigma factor RsiW